MAVGAVVVGAGASSRAGFDKVFALLAGEPVLAYSVQTMQDCPVVDRVVVVLSRANLARGGQLARDRRWTKVLCVCEGGPRRQDSVAAGLARLDGCEWAVIHDAARPLLTAELIEKGLLEAAISGAAIAAVPVTDTIKVVGADRTVRATPSRTNLWAVQTPQVFRYEAIAAAYRETVEDVTDDASLLEQRGQPVRVYYGTYDNVKITLPDDLALAEFLLERRRCRG